MKKKLFVFLLIIILVGGGIAYYFNFDTTNNLVKGWFNDKESEPIQQNNSDLNFLSKLQSMQTKIEHNNVEIQELQDEINQKQELINLKQGLTNSEIKQEIESLRSVINYLNDRINTLRNENQLIYAQILEIQEQVNLLNNLNAKKRWSFNGYCYNNVQYNNKVVFDFKLPASGSYAINWLSFKQQANGHGGFCVGVLSDYSQLTSDGLGGWFPNGDWKWRCIIENTKEDNVIRFDGAVGEHLLILFGQTIASELTGSYTIELTME